MDDGARATPRPRRHSAANEKRGSLEQWRVSSNSSGNCAVRRPLHQRPRAHICASIPHTGRRHGSRIDADLPARRIADFRGSRLRETERGSPRILGGGTERGSARILGGGTERGSARTFGGATECGSSRILGGGTERGSARILGGGMERESARTFGGATECGSSRILGGGMERGSARIFGGATKCGSARILGGGTERGSARTFGGATEGGLNNPRGCLSDVPRSVAGLGVAELMLPSGLE